MLVFDDFDLLDVGAPYEVLLTASRLAQRTGATAPFEVVVVGTAPDPVTAYGGMMVTPTATLEDVGPLDVLVVPGAIDVAGALAAPALVGAVGAAASRVPVVASVCTGAFVLGRAGLLSGRAWTTHWEDVDALAAEVGDAGARRDVRGVDDGPVVTGGGLSCGLDLGLHLVDRWVGRELAVATARQVDHRWSPTDGATA
jgi:transcriptional regulator GlxA family with amidase domain